MKHIFALAIFILVSTASSFAQLINWPESFEGSFPPAGWTLINGGDVNTWIKYTGMPHSGAYHAGIVYNATTAHNDYLIAPRLAPVPGNSNFLFWARNFSAVYPDLFDIKLSTTGTQMTDFTITIATNLNAPETYTKYEYDLSAYYGQKVYIAIVAKTMNGWSLFIDDVNGCLEWNVPDPASNPLPINASTGIVPGTNLNWTAPTSGYAFTAFKLYLGTTPAANEILNGINIGNVTTYTPSQPLNLNTTYYWKVVPINVAGDAVSVPVWSFTTVEGVGTLDGTITSCHGVPVSGVGVYVNGPVTASFATALDGKYLLTGLPIGTYTLTAQKPGFNTFSNTGVVIGLNATTTLDFTLTQPEMIVTPAAIVVTLNPGEFLSSTFSLTNAGCGPLNWTSSIGNWSSTNHNWVSFPNSTGSVPASSNATAPVWLNATGLFAGTTQSSVVTFTSNPDVGSYSIPVSIMVAGQVLRQVSSLTGTLISPLTGTVTLNWACNQSPGFLYYSIKRNGTQIGTTIAKSYNDILPGFGSYTYEVAAIYSEGATAPKSAVVEWLDPVLTWTPAQLNSTVWAGQTKIVPLSIGNSGNGTLIFNATPHAFVTAVAPPTGNVAPEEFQVINTTFSATGAYSAFGVYTNPNVVTITSNDQTHLSVNIPATMTVTKPGTISGVITDGLTGNSLQGVLVTAGTFSALTNDFGIYTLQVDPGTYSMVFEKTGYQSITVTGTVVVADAITAVNAVMNESLYPPGCLMAVVNPEDTQCVVSWCAPAGAYELLYDDGTAENFASWQLPGNMNAVKFTPRGYPAKVLGGKFYVGTGSFPVGGNFIGKQFAAMVYKADGTGGMPGTVLDSVAVTVNSFGWIDVLGLNADITSGDFYLVMMQLSAEPNCVPIGVDETLPKYYKSYSRNVSANGSWVVSPYQDFMMHAIVSGPMTADDDQSNSANILIPEKVTGMMSQSQPLANAGTEINTAMVAAPEGFDNTDMVHHYVISRIYLGPVTPVAPANGVFTLLNNNVSATTYTEGGSTWSTLTKGWYAYCVKAIYPNGQESDCAYTGNTPHKLFADVTVKVKQTCGMVPAEGAIVKLTGSDYPYSVLTATVPASGSVFFDNVIKGRYELNISKSGYTDYITPVVVEGNMLIDKPVLEDIRYKPRNLLVDGRTLVARWDQPTRAALEEDFEGTTFPPQGWTRTSSGIGWFGTTNANSPYFFVPEHTRYAVANDDVNTTNNGCCDLLITPAMDFTHEPSMVLSFQSYFTGAFGHKASVKVSTDGGITWVVVYTLTGESGWKPITVNLAAFAGPSGSANVKIAFHSDDNGLWANGWAIDDVVISPSGVTVVNPVNGYAVFLDGALVGQTTELKWTFNPGAIMYGQTYEAGVAGQYCSGFSEKVLHTFRSSFLYPPKHLTATANTSSTSGSTILNWEGPSGDDQVTYATTLLTPDGLPANLLNYKLYRNREFIASIPKTDIEYWDNNLEPEEYCYDISAVYDLSPYGPSFVGQTGESYWEGTPCVNIQYGFDLPFFEDFASGQFAVNNWTVGTNWIIDGQTGNPAPSAKFKWDEALVNYSSSLTSYYIVAANNNTTTPFKIWLDYTIKLDDRSASKKEMMSVEVWNGTGWSKVKEYTNTGDFGWENEHINITSIAKNKVIKVRYRANGMNSGDINSWSIDSVHVYFQYQFNPARNLVANWYGIPQNDIKLQWNAPIGMAPGVWLHYDDGINLDAVGTGGVADFDVAIRFQPDQLTEYDGYAVKKIKFFPYEADCEYSIRVWSGTNAGTLLVDQPVASPNIKVWNEINLDAPALIDATKELWVGFRCNANTGYPAGVDEALSAEGYSNMINFNGVWTTLTALAPSLTNDWNIQAFVDGPDDAPATAIQPIVQGIQLRSEGALTLDPTKYANPSNLAARTTVDSSYDSPDALSGYDVYRRAYNKFPPGQNTSGTGEWIKINPSIVTALQYIDLNMTITPNNCFEYHVIARYTEGNSVMSNIDWVCFPTGLNPGLSNEIKVYPNPASDYVRVDLSGPVSGKITIYNSAGSEVTSFFISGENTLTINTVKFPAGIYSLKITLKSGETFNSKFVIIK